MTATYGHLHSFVRKNGKVKVLDTQGRARILPSGEEDIFGVIEKADRFWFRDKWYSRSDFEALMDQLR